MTAGLSAFTNYMSRSCMHIGGFGFTSASNLVYNKHQFATMPAIDDAQHTVGGGRIHHE
jgi:hypothetical protein